MTPGTLNLSVVAGDGYSHTLTFTDADGVAQDQSAYTFRAQVREATWAETAADFGIDDTDAATGVIVISLTAVQTRALRTGSNVWDIERELTAGGDPQTLLQGKFTVTPDVTREA
jgi:hypothetical protein